MIELVEPPAPEPPPIPRWIVAWWCGEDTGDSSKTIAAVLSGERTVFRLTLQCAPSDASDVGRCVRLLDLAARNGEDWRRRLPEVGAVCQEWGPLAARWEEVEAAWRHDVRMRSEPATTSRLIREIGGGR